METKRRIPDKDVQHLLRNAVSDESGKRVSISIVSGIREIKKMERIFEKVTSAAAGTKPCMLIERKWELLRMRWTQTH